MRQFQGSILVFVNTSRKALAVLLILAAGLVSLRSQDLRSTPPILSSPSSLFPTPAPPTLPTPDKSVLPSLPQNNNATDAARFLAGIKVSMKSALVFVDAGSALDPLFEFDRRRLCKARTIAIEQYPDLAIPESRHRSAVESNLPLPFQRSRFFIRRHIFPKLHDVRDAGTRTRGPSSRFIDTSQTNTPGHSSKHRSFSLLRVQVEFLRDQVHA